MVVRASLRFESVNGVVVSGRVREEVVAQGVRLIVLGVSHQGREDLEELRQGGQLLATCSFMTEGIRSRTRSWAVLVGVLILAMARMGGSGEDDMVSMVWGAKCQYCRT